MDKGVKVEWAGWCWIGTKILSHADFPILTGWHLSMVGAGQMVGHCSNLGGNASHLDAIDEPVCHENYRGETNEIRGLEENTERF